MDTLNQGIIYVIGIGAGTPDTMTAEAASVLMSCDIIAGYSTYTEQISWLTAGKEVLSSGMGQEVARCEAVLELAENGKNVALISSGDAGIYGMAGVMLEVADKRGSQVPIRVIPGLTAALLAGAALGAPLMNDFAVISLSDLLTPWPVIVRRLHACGEADLVIALYNPKSRGRSTQIIEAQKILLGYRSPETPVGIVQNAGRSDQVTVLTDLSSLHQQEIDMSTVVVIGCRSTAVTDGRMVTSRGYPL